MKLLLSFVVPLFALAATSFAATDQKLLGPSFEPPTNISSSKVIGDAVSKIVNSLKNNIHTGESPYGSFNSGTTSLSLTVVSQHDALPIIDFHHTSNSLNISAGSTSKVTADSIYRIGSISKLFTVYALLVNNGTAHWNRPVTDYVPELLDAVQNPPQGSSVIDRVQWDQVTVGALTSQLSGIGRDYNEGDLAVQNFPWTETGLPVLPPQDIPSCAANDTEPPCTRREYFKGYLERHPVFPPYSKPLYSNAAYRILAYVIETITGKTYTEVVSGQVFGPLNMNHSSTLPPQRKGLGVIPNGPAGWDRLYGDEVATGGLLSSTNDLPNTLTSSTSLSVGAPWEIVRTRSRITVGHLVDLYTKSGSVDLYESLLILVPDYQVTIAALAAGVDASAALHTVIETATQNLLPALERSAALEACNKFCGEYKPANSQNSSLVLAIDDEPGLLVKKWLSQGHDILATAQAYANATRGGQITGLRLFPTGLQTKDQAAYRALFLTTPFQYNPKIPRVFDPNAEIWGLTDQLMYGEIAVDDFMFHLDGNGATTAIEPRVMRQVYEKVRE